MFGSGITAGEIVIIITTTASAIVTVINSISAGWGRKEMRSKVEEITSKTDINSNKLDVIHESANGNLGAVQSQLDEALTLIADLQRQMAQRRSTDFKGNSEGR